MKIIKRDGIKLNFNPIKIENAVMKAFIAVDGQPTEYAIEKAKNIASYIENYCLQKNKVLTVEEVQDMVVKTLIEQNHVKTSVEYILYREERNKKRIEEIGMTDIMV